MPKGHAGKTRVDISCKEQGGNMVRANQATVDTSRIEQRRSISERKEETVIDSERVHQRDGAHLAES
eukprot:16035645-Heterocapsa_arctica.AAC.1